VLEESRDAFIDRLHRTSDDYDATNALALVYAAINAVDAQNLPVRPRSKRGQRSSRRSRTRRR
jgi:hypothetical protein